MPRWIFVKIGGNIYVDAQRFNRWINWKEKNRENQRQRAIDRLRKSLG